MNENKKYTNDEQKALIQKLMNILNDMNKVKNWYVKWRELIIVFKDCTELIINESEDYNEYKCPESSKIMIYNNHNEIYETDSDYEN